jgi:DNA-binding transcriptional regulator YiaG
MTNDKIVERARNLYTIIVNRELGCDEDSVMKRVCIIRELEGITHKDFRDTAEFHREVSAFLARKGRIKESVGTQIRHARIKAGLTMKGLAKELGVSTKMVQRWELNVNGYAPSPAAIDWLNKTLSDAPGSIISEKGQQGKED